jgi:hypothetical protein
MGHGAWGFCQKEMKTNETGIGERERRRERTTSKEHLNRPPFSSPLSSTEKERKRGEKVQIWLIPYKKEN